MVIVSATFLSFHLEQFHWPYDPDATNLEERLQSPSLKHPFGTDAFGRDVLSRMLYGAWISLTVGFVAVGVAATIGIFIGSISGYFGGWIDVLLMRFVDIVMSFPSFFLILTLVAIISPNIWNVMIVIGLTGWTGTARLVRAEFLTLKERDFSVAAKALGAKDGRIIFRHILPNALTPVLVSATLGVAGAILIEASLSFLGLGVQPPRPTWGNILYEGRAYVIDAPWLTIFPGFAILFTVLAFNLLGEGFRDAIDPKLRKQI
jgi:peptide/nickel transport system permease protein